MMSILLSTYRFHFSWHVSCLMHIHTMVHTFYSCIFMFWIRWVMVIPLYLCLCINILSSSIMYIFFILIRTPFSLQVESWMEERRKIIYILLLRCFSLYVHTYIPLYSIQSNSKKNRFNIFTLTSSPFRNNMGKKFDERGV